MKKILINEIEKIIRNAEPFYELSNVASIGTDSYDDGMLGEWEDLLIHPLLPESRDQWNLWLCSIFDVFFGCPTL